MGQIFDVKTSTVTLANDASETLDISSAGSADDTVFLVDDGNGNAPATYDLLCEVDARGDDTYQYYDDVSGRTDRSWQDPAIGKRLRYTLTNQSGGSATYRITIVTQR